MVKQLVKKSFINPYFAFLILAAVSTVFYLFVTQVDLQPQVTSSFFFSPKSKIYKNNALIYKKFIVAQSIVLNLPTKDISSQDYIHTLKTLSSELENVKGIESVKSLTRGPPDLDAGKTDPMWKRFLDSGSGKSSLIVCFIEENKVSAVVRSIEKILAKPEYKKRAIYISGIPYIIEKIRQMLSRDMKDFIVGATLVSSSVLLIIFMSLVVTLGAILTALCAAALTLLVQHYFSIPVGILTANLGAIVYVLTTSHIVFLTSNWRHDSHDDKKQRLASTIVTTLPASFWAAATTIFGFASLIFVEAKPLQQLGIGGTIGTLSAFIMAYTVFPMFLRFSRKGKSQEDNDEPRFFLPFPLFIGLPLAMLLLGGAFYLGWMGLNKVDTDPSLLTYFKKSQSIYQGIKHLDQYGGSNPLNFVISDRSGDKLTNKKSYQKMMDLQKDLESHPAVGSVLSLPILMDQTQENWLARFIPWGSLMSILSRQKFDKIARGFITEDFHQGLFIIRMKETGRSLERYKIVNQLMAKPRKHGLRLNLVGGSYYMQSELAKRIKSSMKTGILALIALFVVIILILSFSIPITLYASLSIIGATAAFLGVVGLYQIPVDIISSPAINVVLGLAVDGMIHIILAARRHSEIKGFGTDAQGWVWAIKSQGKAVLISGVIIAAGFSVFYLSNFPPSQRFGLEIVFGTLLAMLMTLFALPHLSLMFRKQTPKPQSSD